MKRGLIILVLVSFVVSLAAPLQSAFAADKPKIGYADIGMIINSYKKAKDQDTNLSGKVDKKKKEHDLILEKIKNMKNEMELLSEEQRQKKQDEMDEEIRKLQDFDRDAKQTLLKERDIMIRDIYKEIETAVDEYAQKNGYTMILNGSGQLIVYGQKQDDITEPIIELLNSKYSSKKK